MYFNLAFLYQGCFLYIPSISPSSLDIKIVPAKQRNIILWLLLVFISFSSFLYTTVGVLHSFIPLLVYFFDQNTLISYKCNFANKLVPFPSSISTSGATIPSALFKIYFKKKKATINKVMNHVCKYMHISE